MFRNDGDGTFTDVTAETGTGSPDWSVSAGFPDVDHDGWLDLFVGNYLRYTLDTHIPCFSASGPLDYCAPEHHPPQRSRFYRNHGDGTFTEATAAAGMAEESGRPSACPAPTSTATAASTCSSPRNADNRTHTPSRRELSRSAAHRAAVRLRT